VIAGITLDRNQIVLDNTFERGEGDGYRSEKRWREKDET